MGRLSYVLDSCDRASLEPRSDECAAPVMASRPRSALRL